MQEINLQTKSLDLESRESSVAISRYSKETPDPLVVKDIALVFAEVFAGYPWYEVFKCNGCDSYFDSDVVLGQLCACCGKDYTSIAYPLDETEEMIRQQFSNEWHALYLSHSHNDKKRVEGFAWGSKRSLEQTTQYLPENLRSATTQEIQRFAITNDRFFAISEIGVREEVRGKGLGKILFNFLVEEARLQMACATVWTRSDTVLTPICLKAGFTQVFGPEMQIENGRVANTGKIIVGQHSATPERVMFISPI